MNYDESLGRKVGMLYRLLSRRLNTLLAAEETGITVDQFRLLTVLWRADGITQQQLAGELGRDRASVTRMTDILEEKGLLARVPDKSDRRINLLYLLKRGRELEPQAAACAKRALDDMTRGFTHADQAAFAQFCERAMHNLR